MRKATLSAVLACLMVSAAAGQTPIPGYPGLTEEDLQELIDQASSATGVDPDQFCVLLRSRVSNVPAATRCRPDKPTEQCPEKHQIVLFPNRMADVYKVPKDQRGSYTWMTGDFSGSVIVTLMHEMLHACAAAGGQPCQTHPEHQFLCDEIFIDVNLADELCDLITELNDLLCAMIAEGLSSEELEIALALRRRIDGLCETYELMRSMYNTENKVEWWCMCQDGTYGPQYPWPPALPDCPSLIMPPVPAGGGGNPSAPCDYGPGNIPDLIPPCPACNVLCDVPQ